MPKHFAQSLGVAIVATLSFVSIATLRAQTDARLLSDADYRTSLSQLEALLPQLEAAFNNIKPENDPHMSYADGQFIAENRDMALAQLEGIHKSIVWLRQKRTVAGEVSLSSQMQDIYESMLVVVGAEAMANTRLSYLEKLAPDLNRIALRVANDSIVRVGLLEKGTCP